MFVTSAEYTGNLGGLDGADAKCQAHATNAGFVGTFYAWLSTAQGPALGHPEVGPLHRFTRHAVRYVRPDGVKVADHFGDLIDGTLDNPINVDDLGNQLFFENFTWSSTTANGVPAGLGHLTTCENWTADGPFKVAYSLGSVGATDFNWSSPAFSAAEPCYSPHRLICVEQ